MIKYIMKRIITGLLALFLLITVTFWLTRMMPGSPFQGGNTNERIVAALEMEYGLSEPLAVQYRTYLSNLLKGNLGISFQKPGVTVNEVILRAWPSTFTIGLAAVFLSLAVGAALGIGQAVSQNKWVRGGIFGFNLLGTAIPNFVLGLVLMLVLGVKLKLFPVTGLTSAANYVLPVLSLAAYPTAVVARIMQNACREELSREYVQAAAARGLKKRQIIFGHVLRHAWIPVLNFMGPLAAFMLTGSFVVESIFTIPGLGREFVLAISNRDYTLIMGLTIFMGMVIIVINLLTDLLCAALDPAVHKSQKLSS